MKKLLLLALVLAGAYGIYDLVREVRGTYTSEYARTYSRAVGMMMCPDFALPAAPMGTSFSTPVVTGLCACLVEYRKMRRDSLIDLLHASGTRSANPDRETGYGVPQTSVLLRLIARL